MKKYFLHIISLFLLTSFLYLQGFAGFEILDTKYQSFTEKLEKKYTDNQILGLLEKVSKSLDSFLAKKNLSETKLSALRYLYNLNRDKINSIKNSSSPLQVQRVKETKYIILTKDQTKREIPAYISTLGKNIYPTNKQNEFVKDGTIYKVKFSEYFSIGESNAAYFEHKNGIIVSPEKNVFYFIENYSIEEKIAFSDLYDDNTWDSKFIDINARYIKEGTTYYGINFINYNIFSNSYGFLKSDLPKGDIIFVRDNEDRFGYINDFKKSKLISEDIFEAKDLRENLLKNIVDDKRHIETNSDTLFKDLKKLTLDITAGAKTDEEKIKRIYAWILDNISYSRVVDFEDKKIFSGIDTYKNSDGVCEGYAKLMSYMLFFAGIQNSEVIRGDVIDAQDFPSIGHAWVKIGDKYYDPTFDDPLGITTALTFDRYKFFGLPKDLFYTNRYDEGNTPESIKTMTLVERQDIIKKNLSSLLEKYQGKNYVLLKALEFRKKYSLQGELTFKTLKNILSEKSLIPGVQYRYYEITKAEDIEIILSQFNYDTSKLFLVEGKDNQVFEIK